MGVTGKRRSGSQIARDRRRIADMYLEGRLQVDIAQELGLSTPTISRDIAALQAEWLSSALYDFNEAKAREIAKIDRLEREYWIAWERSCEDAETETSKSAVVGDKKRAEATKTTKGQAGDPRFLSGVQWCIERRCKLLGIDAPLKGILGNFDMTALSLEQLERLAAGDDPLKVLLMSAGENKGEK